MNNRCGALPQFDTPEYASFSSVQTWRHESSEGIDPYSCKLSRKESVCVGIYVILFFLPPIDGYNRITKDEDYRSAEDIIHKIVNIVSKNGN
jgi:alpha-L-fucosidase